MIRIQRVNRIRAPWLQRIGTEVTKLEKVVKVARDIDKDAYFSSEGGKHFLVDFDLIDNLHEALKEAGDLLEGLT
jgi:hypothetical protein